MRPPIAAVAQVVAVLVGAAAVCCQAALVSRLPPPDSSSGIPRGHFMPITVDDAGPSAYARVSTHGLTPRALGVPEGNLRPPRQGTSGSDQRRQLDAPGNTLYVAIAGAHLAAEVVVVVHASCSYPQCPVTKLRRSR